MINRNVEGLRSSAEEKRKRSFEKFEEGIQKLLKEQKAINFSSIAEVSGLSRGWLYKEPEVKARIQQLREQTEKSKKIPSRQKPSDASKDALIKTLKARLKKVEAENKGLKQQLEIVYGQMSYGKEVEQKIQRLESENTKLKNKLYSPISNDVTERKVINIHPQTQISERILNELEALSVDLSSTLKKKIINASEEVVLIAIEALKEQMDLQVVRRPGAWLSSAISDAWKPNEAIGGLQPKDSFEEWFDLAREYGKVTRCRQEENGSWSVQEITGEWHLYQEFSQKWTLEYLRKAVPN